MVLVLAWPIVLVLPKEKPVLCVVVAWPNGLKRLAAGCWVCWPNRLPAVVPKLPAAAVEDKHTQHVASLALINTSHFWVMYKIGSFWVLMWCRNQEVENLTLDWENSTLWWDNDLCLKTHQLLLSSPLTCCSKGALVLPEGEAGVGGRGTKQASGGAGCGRGWTEQTACRRSHRVGWALPARLVVLKPQLLQGHTWEKTKIRS